MHLNIFFKYVKHVVFLNSTYGEVSKNEKKK